MATFEIVRYGAFNQKSTLSFSDESKALEEYGYDSRNASRGRIEKVELVKDGAVIRFTVEGGEDTEVAGEQPVVESVEVAVSAPKAEVKKVEEKKVMAASPTKAQFQFGHETYNAYWNGKTYGPKEMIYISFTRAGGTNQRKGSYSRKEERFVDYQAGTLDLVKLAAKALAITE